MADSYKLRIYEILEATRSHDDAAEAVNLFLHVLVILNIASVVLETVDGVYLAHREFFQLFADISVAIFTGEYLLRLWSCDVDPRYARPFSGRIRYALTPLAMIDLLVITAHIRSPCLSSRLQAFEKHESAMDLQAAQGQPLLQFPSDDT